MINGFARVLHDRVSLVLVRIKRHLTPPSGTSATSSTTTSVSRPWRSLTSSGKGRRRGSKNSANTRSRRTRPPNLSNTLACCVAFVGVESVLLSNPGVVQLVDEHASSIFLLQPFYVKTCLRYVLPKTVEVDSVLLKILCLCSLSG